MKTVTVSLSKAATYKNNSFGESLTLRAPTPAALDSIKVKSPVEVSRLKTQTWPDVEYATYKNLPSSYIPNEILPFKPGGVSDFLKKVNSCPKTKELKIDVKININTSNTKCFCTFLILSTPKLLFV